VTARRPQQARARRPFLIGLTGGVGAGKSTAEQILRDAGIPVADADAWAHAVLATNTRVQRAVRAHFRARHAARVTTPDGALDRRAIAAIAFQDAASLAFLEKLIHPLVRRRAAAWRAEQRAAAAPTAVVIVPLLFESGMDAACDATIAVEAPVAMRRARLRAARGWSAKHCADRMRHQLSDAERRRRATIVVKNAASRAAFARALLAAVNDLCSGRNARESTKHKR